MNIHDYICEFQQKYHRFQEVDGELPDKVLACMLLASCQLSEDKNQLVKTGLVDISFANMVATLKRVFGNENQKVSQPSADRSEVVQQVFYSEESTKLKIHYILLEIDSIGDEVGFLLVTPLEVGLGQDSEEGHSTVVINTLVIDLTHWAEMENQAPVEFAEAFFIMQDFVQIQQIKTMTTMIETKTG